MMNNTNLVMKFISNKSEKNFKNLYKTYANDLQKTALYFTKYDQGLAEDLVQETWITIVEKIDNFRQKSSFKTWITGILINKIRENNRKIKPNDDLEINHHKVSEVATNINLALDLKTAILKLPEGYHKVITLHDIQGFKHKEIATLLDISIGTSKSQLFHARKALRISLTSYK